MTSTGAGRAVEEFLRIVPGARAVLDEVIAADPEYYGAWARGRVDDLLEFLLQAFSRPVLLPLLRAGATADGASVRASFEYVESLASDPNSYVESSVYFGILEQFLESEGILLAALRSSLPVTRAKIVSMLEEYPATLRELRAAGALE
ncbi:hypothetical protein ACFVJK_12910 [Streptomyces sp. NPDC127172]|uniref:hypothetical protein n=1 Tax=Streptomyces sp. NPDC127172 TaxID=3345382 RepID=UPI00363E93D0